MSMRLKSIRLENVRRYVEPALLDHLEPGLNLIVGPNGAGKSTWVRALRAAFFAFHRSRQVKDLVPWAAPGASPRITVDFEIDGKQYHLSKQFFKGAFVRLQTPAELFEADLAEAQIALLLGFEPVTRGEARQIGIPGLLWLEQGARPALGGADSPLDPASDYLREALGSAMGEVTSSSGDEVLQQLENELGQLRVRGRDNSSKGELAAALASLQSAEQQQQVLQSQLTEFRDRVDQLGGLRTQIAHDRAEKPWESLQAQASAARERLTALGKVQNQLEQLRQEAGHLQARKELLHREVQRQQALLASLDDRQRATRQAGEAVQALQEQQELTRGRLEKAQNHLLQCQQQLESARDQQQRQELLRREQELKERLDQRNRSLDSSQSCLQRIEALTALLSGRMVLPATLERLREIEQEQALLTERMSASGTEIEFDIATDEAVALDDEPLSGKGVRVLTHQQTLRLAGVGTVSIKPGSAELEKNRQAIHLLQAEYTSLLNQSGYESTELVAKAVEERRQAEAERQIEQARLQELAPRGVEQLRLSLAEIQGELEQLQAQLSRLSADKVQKSCGEVSSLPDVAAAQAALDTATEVRAQAELTDRAATEDLSGARSVLRHAEQELLVVTQARLAEQEPARAIAGSSEQSASAAESLAALSERINTLEASMAQLSKTIDSEMPDTLALDVQRYSESAKQALDQARRREVDEVRMAAELSQAGAAGVEEALQLANAELERCQRRATDLTIRADALSWLVNRIRERRQALTTRLQAPLQQRMDYYLKQLLPGVELTMNADLAPESIQDTARAAGNGSLREAVAEQSYGTQEQISLVARLAYADLLAASGRATLLLIDDGILNTDGERLERVKRILYDASQRHQVLLFSCHPERWSGLGVAARDVPRAVSVE